VAVSARQPAPPLAGKLLGGGAGSLAALRGKVVVLNSWASWCEPCRQELPALARFARSSDARTVEVLGIDVRDAPGAAAAMARTYKLGYPSLVDPTGSLLASLGSFVPPADVPSTIVVDRSGRVAAMIIGPVDGATLAKVVQRIAAER
jgi:thiol-disulfide isomerase/thioredoxin